MQPSHAEVAVPKGMNECFMPFAASSDRTCRGKIFDPARPALCHADALRFPLISRRSAESFFLAGLVFCSSLEHLVKLVVLGKLHCLFCRRLCKLRLAV